jgi:hypothetical protein
MKKKKLESELREFNDKDYNNQKAILGFIMNKSKGEDCRICEKTYHRKFCNLCKKIIAYQNISRIYNEINSRALGSFKLEI